MITDQQTNTVFFAESLSEDYPGEYKELTGLITRAGCKVKTIYGTEDYYCRDFMPVQVSENHLVQFVFRPEAYLKEDGLELMSNPVLIELLNRGKFAQPLHSPIILDGGNIVKSENKVIITDRVLKDNRYQFPDDHTILERLKYDLKCEVIIIPEYPEEETGHADGLIRFVDENTVLINDEATEPEKEWLRELLLVLKTNGLKHISIPCDLGERAETADGLYINYLHVGNLVVVPQFGFKSSDQKTIEIMNQVFGKTHRIIPFRANWLAENGGVFNCASWTVKE
jgi:agmatine deiminase